MPDFDSSTHGYSSPVDYLGIRLERTLSKESLNSELSYLSTSTMTMTDNPGTGRVLDKFVFQRGGRMVERCIGRVAHATGIGPAAVAQRIGNHLRGFSLDPNGIRPAEAEEETSIGAVRLDMGLVQDVDRLRANCTKLFLYTLSGSTLMRIQALRLIILLFIRFPYLRYYFDSPVITKYLLSIQIDPHRHQVRKSTEDSMLADLSRMAYSCLLPGDATVARLVDHLAERIKYAEGHRRGPESTGPFSGHLPDHVLIQGYCTNPNTSFAALRFTATLFRHFFLTCGPAFYLKLNDYSAPFWEAMVAIVRHNLVSLVDVDGTELFILIILEMLCCAVSWDKNFEPGNVESRIVETVLSLLQSPMHLIVPQSSHFASSVLRPRWEEAKYEHRMKVAGKTLDSLDDVPHFDPVDEKDLYFDRKKCTPLCDSASLAAFRHCENCSQFLAFAHSQVENDV